MSKMERKGLPRREWARREVAKIDAQLLAPSAYEPNWRRYRSAQRGRDALHARRERLARIAGPEIIPDEDCGPF
jgi:hypothetical protein